MLGKKLKKRPRFKDIKIRNKLLIAYSLVFVLAFTVGGLLIYQLAKDVIEKNVEMELKNASDALLHLVKKSTSASISNYLRAVAEKNKEIADHFHLLSRMGVLTAEEAKSRTMEIFSAQTIGSSGFIYCLDSQGLIRVHPHLGQVGRDVSEKDWARRQTTQKEGYMEIQDSHPDYPETRTKSLYMVYFEPWDWIISVSAFKDELNMLLLAEEIRGSVLSWRFGRSGYPYIIDYYGTLIVHPSLEGENLIDARDAEERLFVKEICDKREGRISYFWRNPGEAEARKKLVIFQDIPELGWIVACSSYYDEIYEPVNKIAIIILGAFIAILILFLPVSFGVSSQITRRLSALMENFEKASNGQLSVRLETDSKDELGRLMEYFNEFMDEIEAAATARQEEILERVLAEKRLKDSESKYRALYENAVVGIFQTSLEGAFLSVNRAFSNILGYEDPEDLISSVRNMAVEFYVDPEDYQSFRTTVSERGLFLGSEAQVRKKDGQAIWVYLSARVVYNADGRPDYYEGSLVDITERKKTEEALRESEEKYRTILDNIEEGYYEVDLKGEMTFFNESMRKILGYEADELRGLSNRAYMDEAVAAKVFKTFNQVYQSGRPERVYDWQIIRKTGEKRWIEASVSLLTGPDGGPIGFRGISRDVTERKEAEEELARHREHLEELVDQRTAELNELNQKLELDIKERKKAEKALRESEERIRLIMDAAPDPIVVYDADGLVTYLNPAFTRVFGWGLEELLDKKVDYIPEDLHLETSELISMTQKGISVHGFETKRLTRDGRKLEISISAANFTDIGGNTRGSVVTLQDITERKKAEEELRKAREAADAATRAKSEFLANMSHEIRTPMNGVVGMAEILLETELTEEQRRFTETISASANSLLTVINDILDYSKIEAGKLDLNPEPFDFQTAIEDVGQLLAMRAEEKGIDIIVHYSPEAPRYLVGDPARLRQVVMNLAGNAVKFTETGYVLIEVECARRWKDRAMMEVRVIDTGPGIPPKALDNIFDKFTQADATITRRFGGTGLGLAISKELIELMDGTIDVTSRVGKGSNFFFQLVLPLAEAVEPPDVSAANISGLKVLVIDDNVVNRRVLQEHLRSWEVETEETHSGHEAFEKIKSAAEAGRPFDLILLDPYLKDMHGRKLIQKIKKDQVIKPPAVVIFSSLGQKPEMEIMEEIGSGAFISRPIRASELLFTLQAACYAHQKGEDRFLTPEALSVLKDSKTKPREDRPAQSQDSFPSEVLVVEDNPSNQFVARTVLERMGCKVFLADNGQEAVDLLKERSFDLVFMDQQMPIMDGFEATRAIRQQEAGKKRTPIVAMTANAMAGDRDRALAAGMDDYVSKPIKGLAVKSVLEKFLTRVELSPTEKMIKVLIAVGDGSEMARLQKAVREMFPGGVIKKAFGGIEACTMIGSFLPDIFLTDLDAKEVDGLAVIRLMRQHDRYARIRVGVLVDEDDSPQKIRVLNDLGVREIIVKPFDPEKLSQLLLGRKDRAAESEAGRESAVESEPEAEEAAPILDRSYILETLGDDPEIISEFIDIFISDLPEQVDDLIGAVEQGDLKTTEAAAHKIKGGASEVGGLQLRQAAWDIEKAAKNGDLEQAREITGQVRELCSRLEQALQSEDWTA